MIEITDEDFSPGEMIERARRPDAGAVVSFLGTVRDDGIMGMEVEAYREAALPELEGIEKEAMERFAVSSVDVVHRVGRLQVGENIVFIVCAASHRKAAFEACTFVLEELKGRATIWKKEIRPEGDVWVRGDGELHQVK